MTRYTVSRFAAADAALVDALQLALLIEYLEARFYARAVAASELIPASDLAVFTTMRDHQLAHVTTLTQLILQAGATPISEPAFDYTAKGSATDSSGASFDFLSSQYALFTMLSQAFEDLGVRAYTGQIVGLASDPAVLATVLAIHSVEARHASEVRRLRGRKGWITGANRDELPAFLQPIYDGEDNVIQNGVNVADAAANVGGATPATEAFDEPLTQQQVSAIIAPFLA